MVTFQVRDVPDDLYDELVRKVEVSGLTFDRFVNNILLHFLDPGPGRLSLDEAFALCDALNINGPSGEWAAAYIRRIRDAAE